MILSLPAKSNRPRRTFLEVSAGVMRLPCQDDNKQCQCVALRGRPRGNTSQSVALRCRQPQLLKKSSLTDVGQGACRIYVMKTAEGLTDETADHSPVSMILSSRLSAERLVMRPEPPRYFETVSHRKYRESLSRARRPQGSRVGGLPSRLGVTFGRKWSSHVTFFSASPVAVVVNELEPWFCPFLPSSLILSTLNFTTTTTLTLLWHTESRIVDLYDGDPVRVFRRNLRNRRARYMSAHRVDAWNRTFVLQQERRDIRAVVLPAMQVPSPIHLPP